MLGTLYTVFDTSALQFVMACHTEKLLTIIASSCAISLKTPFLQSASSAVNTALSRTLSTCIAAVVVSTEHTEAAGTVTYVAGDVLIAKVGHCVECSKQVRKTSCSIDTTLWFVKQKYTCIDRYVGLPGFAFLYLCSPVVEYYGRNWPSQYNSSGTAQSTAH
jgi:hypothetical protein